LVITVERFAHGTDDTLGILRIDGEFACYTLEDEHRTKKVYGRTRIPEGTYTLGVRNFGNLHTKYQARFGALHQGMIEIPGVPNFTDILIHCGNRDEDTAGCLLVGDSVNNALVEDGFMGSSSQAYTRLYPRVIEPVKAGDTQLTITDA
jgi:hypothetical protein